MIPPSLTDRKAMIMRPAATTAGSVNLRDAVIAEGRNRRLALMLMLMAFAAAETPEANRQTENA